jgi:probable F420-dependent oxidoreductase
MKFALAVAMIPPAEYLPVAMAAEAAGWDSIAVPDSVFFPEKVSAPYPYMPGGERFWTADTPYVDPWVAIPAMAAVTTRIRLYTSVLKLPIRQPLLVAKTVGSAAVLSNNRVGLGVGLSWIPEEFAWCQTDYATRGERVDEAIGILRALFGGGMVEHHGKHYDFGRLQMSPSPTAPVPIYVGGHSEPALRRAARLGDGWTAAMITVDETKRIVDRLRELRVEHGRADVPFEIQVSSIDTFDADGYRRLEDVGVTEVITQPWMFYDGPGATLEQKTASIRRFADDVFPRVPRPPAPAG